MKAKILPPIRNHVPIPEADAVAIVKAGIFSSMAICDDYMTEMNAIIEFVDQNLKDHGIIY